MLLGHKHYRHCQQSELCLHHHHHHHHHHHRHHLRFRQRDNDNQRQVDLMCQGAGEERVLRGTAAAATLIQRRSKIRLKIERGIDLNGWRTNCLIKLRADQIWRRNSSTSGDPMIDSRLISGDQNQRLISRL